MTTTDWHTKQQAAQTAARHVGITHPSDRALRSAVDLPPDLQIGLFLQGGIARTIDGRSLLVRSGGTRRIGLPVFWRLYRFNATCTERTQVAEFAALDATAAIEQANAWLASHQESV